MPVKNFFVSTLSTLFLQIIEFFFFFEKKCVITVIIVIISYK